MKKKDKIEFIYWFAYYNLDSPSVRYRGKYPLDYFKTQKGIEYNFVTPSYHPKKIYYFLKVYFAALFFRRKNSIIVIQRVQSNFIYSSLLKLLIKVQNEDTIYDIDDADYLEINPKTIYYFAKKCNKISAGSNFIQSHLNQFNTKIIHTTSPIVDLNIIKKQRSSIFTIGWIGGFVGEHKQSLVELIFPAVMQITFSCKLHILGVIYETDRQFILDYFSKNLNIEIEIPMNINWNDEFFIQNQITCFDIGIATLLNTPIQISKSGIKTKQYMNNGVPVISSNLSENNSVVIDGKNGYLCNNSNEFNQRINEFYNMSKENYFEFSKNARESIVNFNCEKYYNDFLKIKLL